MNRIILLLLLIISAPAIGQQLPQSKYSPINGPGFIYKRHVQDSLSVIPLASSPHIPYRAGGIRYNDTCECIEAWNGTQWKKENKATQLTDSTFKIGDDTITIRGTGSDLQQVTDFGSKTTDTITAGGIRTKLILSDTADQDDFEIDVFPDLQGYSGVPIIEPMDSMFNWVVNNRTSENIKAVLQVGDLTNVEGFVDHFVRVDTQFDKLDVYNIPHLPVIGNHDYAAPYLRDASTYNDYFGPARYSGKPYYGGCMDGSHENFFILFEAGGHKYAAIGLEFLARDTALNWAQKIIDSLPDREVILVTHAFLGRSGERGTDTTQHGNISEYAMAEGNTPEQMWQKLVRKNKRIFFVVSGHFINGSGTTPPVVKRITSAGDGGNVVYQIVCNYQQDTLRGNGYFMRMKFKPRQNKIDVSFFSPYLGYEDARFASYELGYPAIRVEGAVGINQDGLNVAGETVLDSFVYVRKLPKQRLVITNESSRLDTIPYQTANTVLAGPATGSAANPTFRALVAADIPAGSNNYIQNQTVAAQAAGFYINTPSIISTTSSYRSQLVGNLPADFYIARANSSFNSHLSLQQAGATAPRMAFYHTTSGDFNIRTPSPNGDQIGVIGWHGNRKSDSAITDLMNITAFVRNGVTHTGAEFVLELRDTATGNRTDRFHVTSMGDVRIGGTSTTSYRLHIQSGDAYFAGNSYTIGSKGIGTTSPTARLHLPAGTASANTAPLKLTAGTNLTTPEAGAIEFDGVHYYGTVGSTRHQLDQQGGAQGIDDVLATDNVITTNRSIEIGLNNLNITTGSGATDMWSFGPSENYSYGDLFFGKKVYFETLGGVLDTNVPTATTETTYKALINSSGGQILKAVEPKVYTALLNQSGASAPTATVLGTNTIGTIVWTRNSTGNYTGTLSAAFTANKTWLIVQQGDQSGGSINNILSWTDGNSLLLTVFDNVGNPTDGLTNLSMEIRVYP